MENNIQAKKNVFIVSSKNTEHISQLVLRKKSDIVFSSICIFETKCFLPQNNQFSEVTREKRIDTATCLFVRTHDPKKKPFSGGLSFYLEIK